MLFKTINNLFPARLNKILKNTSSVLSQKLRSSSHNLFVPRLLTESVKRSFQYRGMYVCMYVCMYVDASRTAPTTARLDSLDMLSEEKVKQLISKSSKKSSSLDPMPTPLVIVSRRTSTCNYKAYKFVIRIWSVP